MIVFFLQVGIGVVVAVQYVEGFEHRKSKI